MPRGVLRVSWALNAGLSQLPAKGSRSERLRLAMAAGERQIMRVMSSMNRIFWMLKRVVLFCLSRMCLVEVLPST